MSSDRPLDPIWRAYEIGRDCFKIAKRAVSRQNLEFLNKTDFASVSMMDGAEWIETSRQVSDDLTIVSLWATFERHLVQYLQTKSQKLREVEPRRLGERFRHKLDEEIERLETRRHSRPVQRSSRLGPHRAGEADQGLPRLDSPQEPQAPATRED